LNLLPFILDIWERFFFNLVPTALAKIIGVYSISYRKGSVRRKHDVIVMENLFYQRNISKIFDLKGSLRSRYVHVDKAPANFQPVLLDENLLELMFESPFCVGSDSKLSLGMTIWNDSYFLSELNVMDYSLIVGVDQDTNQLVIGIIDYIRKYTWDKSLESWVKKSISGKNKVPTIISPAQYKERFRQAIWEYFVFVPDIWTKTLCS